jgi:phospholipid/cholesterol/gamma-HCH transport system substrate-binding protein
MANATLTTTRQREPFHRVHRTFTVGLFVLVAAVSISLLLVYTLRKADFFQEWRRLHVCYQSSHGLKEGNDVTISDIRVGYVTKVDLTTEGKAMVTFRVLLRHAHLVRKDSRAVLRQKSMVVGDWLIALSQGSLDYSPVEEDDTLVGEPPVGIDRMLDRVTSMVGTLESILREVEQGHGLVGHLVKDDSLVQIVHGVLGDFRRALHTADRAFVKADRTFTQFDTLGVAGVGLIDSAQVFIDSLQPAVSETQRLLRDLTGASSRLTPMLRQVQVDLKDIEVLLKGLQNHWLFRRSVSKGKANAADTLSDSAASAP